MLSVKSIVGIQEVKAQVNKVNKSNTMIRVQKPSGKGQIHRNQIKNGRNRKKQGDDNMAIEKWLSTRLRMALNKTLQT